MTNCNNPLPTGLAMEKRSAGRKINRRQILTRATTVGLGLWALGCSSQPSAEKNRGAAGSARERIGVKKVGISNVEHNIVFYDKNMYAAHVNRGGLWNFGDGEIAVAHLANTQCPYDDPKWVNHNYQMPTSGVMLHRSFDNGKTWPESEGKKWIWNNNRTNEEIIQWATPVPKKDRAQIDMSAPDSIMHLGLSHYVNSPAVARPFRGLCIRSADRGRTWESKPSVITGPFPGQAFLVANLGHVRFDNGVLGIVGIAYAEQQRHTMFYTSHDNGLSWQPVSVIVSIDKGDPDLLLGSTGRFTYDGVHMLPDGRLMCSMHKIPGQFPCVSFSQDSGHTWSKPRFIVGPGSYSFDPGSKPPETPIGDYQPPTWSGHQKYRSPCALVLRDGRIIVLFARRTVPGNNGIHGVLSDDLGESWSKEFVVWDDAYTADCGYPCATELEDGRIFTAYYGTVKEHPESVEFYRPVRHIRSTTFSV